MSSVEAKAEIIDRPAVPAVQHNGQPETSAVLALIERAAKDTSVDIDKMERLLAMHDRMVLASREQAFNEAMGRAQERMRPVVKDANNPQTEASMPPMAPWTSLCGRSTRRKDFRYHLTKARRRSRITSACFAMSHAPDFPVPITPICQPMARVPKGRRRDDAHACGRKRIHLRAALPAQDDFQSGDN